MKISKLKLLADVAKIKNPTEYCNQYVDADNWEGGPQTNLAWGCNAPLQVPTTKNVTLKRANKCLVPEEYRKHIFDLIKELSDDTVTFDHSNINEFKVSSIKTFRPYCAMIVWRWLLCYPVTAMYAAYFKSQGFDTIDVCRIVPFIRSLDAKIISNYWHIDTTKPIKSKAVFLSVLEEQPQMKYQLWAKLSDPDWGLNWQKEYNKCVTMNEQCKCSSKWSAAQPSNLAARIIKEKGFSLRSCKQILKETTSE